MLRTKSLFYLVIILFFVSCTEIAGDFQAMSKIQKDISKKYGISNVGINITNGKYLTVSLVNTKYNKASSSEKKELVAEISKIVLANMINKEKIEVGRVLFVEKYNYIIYESTESTSYDMPLNSN